MSKLPTSFRAIVLINLFKSNVDFTDVARGYMTHYTFKILTQLRIDLETQILSLC